MARGLISTTGRVKGGPARGGLGRELRFYSDEDLTAAVTIYRRSTGGGAQPSPIIPNAGVPRALLADRASGDTFVTVTDVSDYNVGDLVPIWNATNTVYRVITTITPATRRLDLDSALGVAFTVAAGTQVNATDMEGHIWGWADDTTDVFGKVTELASGRTLPPLKMLARAPVASTGFYEEGALAGTRANVNFIGPLVTAVDDAGNNRVNVTIDSGPVGASYITTVAEAGLSNEQVLGTAVIMADTLANLPAFGVAGRLFFATDYRVLYRDSGAAWVVVCSSVAPQTFITGGTWTKPTWATPRLVIAIVIGGAGGAGGGGGSPAGFREGGGAGGAGAYLVRIFDPSALSATETVTIGAAGTAGAGGSSGFGTNGGAGGDSSFGAHAKAWGGGGGAGGVNNSGTASGAGGGGGWQSAGGSSTGATSGTGGGPHTYTPTLRNTMSGEGADGAASSAGGGNTESGGPGGGGCAASTMVAAPGGSSLLGAGAGGAGGGVTSGGNAETVGAAGGSTGSYVAGTGGAAGAVNGGAGTAGTSRSGTGKAGDGGGGGGGQDSGTGGVGGAGGIPGGGAGGGGGGTTVGGAGGLGGRGEVIILCLF